MPGWRDGCGKSGAAVRIFHEMRGGVGAGRGVGAVVERETPGPSAAGARQRVAFKTDNDDG